MALLSAQCEQVNQTLAREQGGSFSREDLLVMYGRSSAASGQFDVAAAAYAMFLQEFGTTHAFSERVLERLGETLAPLDPGNVTVMQTPGGPRFQPVWRMQHEATADRLRLSAAAYELLAGITQRPDTADRASMSIGWVFRALNDWPASTAAWDRCANLDRWG